MLRVTILTILLTLITLSAWRRPAVAAGGLLAFFSLEQYSRVHISYFASNSEAGNYIAAGLVGLALAFALMRRRPLLRQLPSAGWWLIALYVWALVTSIWSINGELSVATWRSAIPYILLWAGAAPMLVSRSDDVRDLVWSTVLIGGVTLALLMIDTDWQGRTVMAGGAGSSGTHAENPLVVASLGAIVAMAAIVLSLGSRWRWRLVLFTIAALGLAATVRSESRGQFFAAVIATAVSIPFALPRQRLRGWAQAFLVLAAMGAATYWAFDSFADGPRWELEEMTFVVRETRGEMALVVLSTWLQADTLHLIAGLGSSASIEILGTYPHVVPVEILVEEGVIGILLYVGLLLVASKAAWSARQLALGRDQRDRSIVAVIIGFTIFEIAMTLKQGSLLGNLNFLMLIMILGRTESILRSEQLSPPQSTADEAS